MGITPPSDRREAEDIACVAAFLAFAEQEQPKMMRGARYVGEAFEAFARIVSIPSDVLRKGMLGERPR
jgi:hypothetical protein